MSNIKDFKSAVAPTEKTFIEVYADQANAKARAEQEQKFAMLSAMKNDLLLECTKASIQTAMMELASAKLSLNPSLGEAYLVPYKNNKAGTYECQLIVGYRGFCTGAYRSGIVKSITSGVVFATDDFEYELGSSPFIRHKIGADTDQDADNFEYVWCVIETVQGGRIIEVKNRKWCDKRKEKSMGKNAKYGPYAQWPAEMARKAILRYATKAMPKSPELEQMIFMMDQRSIVTEQEPEREVRAQVLTDSDPSGFLPEGDQGAVTSQIEMELEKK